MATEWPSILQSFIIKKIRQGIFETNSSSIHSISINKENKIKMDSLSVVKKTNKVNSQFGEFGWEIAKYDSAEMKLSYLLTMIIETEGKHLSSEEEFYKTNGFTTLNEVIKKVCKCDGICLLSKMETKSYNYDNKKEYYLFHEGYIDHQSTEDYNSMQDFLNNYNLSIEEFIFNKNVVLITDNDNHYIEDDEDWI